MLISELIIEGGFATSIGRSMMKSMRAKDLFLLQVVNLRLNFLE